MRRLIVCFDGTWNTPDSKNGITNVVKMVRAIKPKDAGVSQITFYDKGVGTGGPIDKLLGGATGKGLKGNVIDGYRFLANNYQPGDEIYIFGFSRGAYTARFCAGLIAFCGLLHPKHLGKDLTEHVLGLYLDRSKKHELDQMGFDRHQDVPIACLGVWDTVGSLGIPTDWGRQILGGKYYFSDSILSPQVKIGLHAIAIDEKRGTFPPTLWVYDETKGPPTGQELEQVWFAGAHGNVGGGVPDAGLSDIAFDWMVKRVQHHTPLCFDQGYLDAHVSPKQDGKGYETRTGLYWTSHLHAYQRLINQILPSGKGPGHWFRAKFQDFDRRNIIPKDTAPANEALHIAAIERWCTGTVYSDATKDSDGPKRDYRPVTLGAVIEAGKTAADADQVPIIDWSGERLDAETAKQMYLNCPT